MKVNDENESHCLSCVFPRQHSFCMGYNRAVSLDASMLKTEKGALTSPEREAGRQSTNEGSCSFRCRNLLDTLL